MDKRTKGGVLATTIITLALLALLNVFTFAIPFTKVSTISHFLNYGLASFVLIVQGVIFAITMFGERDPGQRVLGLPIIHSGFVALGLQLIASIVFFSVNAFIELPIWVVVVVEAVVIGYMIICASKGFFFKSHVQAFKESEKNTKFMDEFRARMKALVAINAIESISRELEDLNDIVRGSDPITNDKTLDSESELLSLLQELDEAIKEGNESNARDILTRMRNTLTERNALCKAGK